MKSSPGKVRLEFSTGCGDSVRLRCSESGTGGHQKASDRGWLAEAFLSARFVPGRGDRPRCHFFPEKHISNLQCWASKKLGQYRVLKRCALRTGLGEPAHVGNQGRWATSGGIFNIRKFHRGPSLRTPWPAPRLLRRSSGPASFRGDGSGSRPPQTGEKTLVPVYTHEQFKNDWLQRRIDLGKQLKPVVKVKMGRGVVP
jgi:hypothetical protein